MKKQKKNTFETTEFKKAKQAPNKNKKTKNYQINDILHESLNNISSIILKRNNKQNVPQLYFKKRYADQGKYTALKKKKHEINFSNLEQPLQLASTMKVRHYTRNSNPQIQRLQKSMDYKKNTSKINELSHSCRSQTESPQKFVEKEARKITKISKSSRLAPSSGRTPKMIKTQISQKDRNIRHDNSHKTKELLESIKEIKKLHNKKPKREVELKDSVKLFPVKKKSLELKKKQGLLIAKTIKDQVINELEGVQIRFRTEYLKSFNLTKLMSHTSQINDDSLLFRNETQMEVLEDENTYQIQKVHLTENEYINLEELRQYQNPIKKQQQYHQDHIYHEMAKRIQRCWRRYKTGRILKEYAKYFNRTDSSSQELSSKQPQEQLIYQDEVNEFVEINPVPANQKSVDVRDKQQKYQDMIKHIKQQQKVKWDEIIKIISKSLRSSDKQNTKEVLQKIIINSQNNKQSLEDKFSIQQFQTLEDKSSSQKSIGNPFEEFNNRKYKELLDPQMAHQVIRSRQKVLNQREKTERHLIQAQFLCDLISKSTYELNCIKLDKWVAREKRNIQTTKRDIEVGMDKAKEVIKKTQLDYLIMQKLMGEVPNKSTLHHSFSEQAVRNVLKKKARHKLHEEDFSEENSKKDYEQFLNSSPFHASSDYNFEDTEMLKKKLQMLNEQVHPTVTEESEETERFLRRQTNSPLHKVHFDNHAESFDDDIESRIQMDEEEDEVKVINSQIIQNKKTSQIEECAKKKGILTNNIVIKQFIFGFSQFILKQRWQVFVNLEKPTGPTALEMLKYMHVSDQDSQIEDQDDDSGPQCVIPNKCFEEYWTKIIPTLQLQNGSDQKEKSRGEYLRSLMRVFFRSIFDALNESLDFERNFGILGAPFPWKILPVFTHLKFQPLIYEKSLERAYHRTIEIASSCCGIIIDDPQGLQVEEQYVDSLRDVRLNRAIKAELNETEFRWLFYDDEETEILVDLSSSIFWQLLDEVLTVLK